MPTSGQPRLLVEERRRKILDLVEKQARVTVEELVNRFGVSAVTVRGDLDALSQSGAVIRSHGGALKRAGALQDVPINVKETLHHGEKVRIGHAAPPRARQPARLRYAAVRLARCRRLPCGASRCDPLRAMRMTHSVHPVPLVRPCHG
jgi:predicted DNA-binding transcriptional regulator YafY